MRVRRSPLPPPSTHSARCVPAISTRTMRSVVGYVPIWCCRMGSCGISCPVICHHPRVPCAELRLDARRPATSLSYRSAAAWMLNIRQVSTKRQICGLAGRTLPGPRRSSRRRSTCTRVRNGVRNICSASTSKQWWRAVHRTPVSFRRVGLMLRLSLWTGKRSRMPSISAIPHQGGTSTSRTGGPDRWSNGTNAK